MALDFSDPDYAEAVEHYLSGRWQEARDALAALAVRLPRNAFIELLQGKCLYSLGRLDEAIARFNAALAINPELGNAHYELGVCYYRCGRLEESLRAFKKTIAIGSRGHAMASYFVGLINHLLGNDRDALEGFSGLRGVSPESLIANFYLAQIKMKERKYDEALGLLTELVARTPGLAEVHFLLGTAYFNLHNTPEAIRCYRRTLELNPDDARARSALEVLVDT